MGSGGNDLCGEGRGDRPEFWGVGPQGTSDLDAPAQIRPLPGSRPVPPLLPDPSLLPPEFGPVFDLFHLTSPMPPPPSRPHQLRPGTRAWRGSGRVSPLPAHRLPLPEVFPHRRVPARPRGAPLHRRRLRGRHAVRAVRQRRPGSEGRTAGAVDGAAGARVLGSVDEKLQGRRLDFPSEPEHRTPLLQPE